MLLSFISDLFSKFKKKKTTIEILEDLDKKIKEIEKNKENNLSNERKIIGKVLLYSIFLYILFAILYYFIPNDVFDPLIGRLLLFVIPVLLYLTRRFLKWFYIKRVGNCESQLNQLKEQKKTIIENVKETETYKKAREILERFSSEVDLVDKGSSKSPTSPQPQSQQQQQQQQNTNNNQQPARIAANPQNGNVMSAVIRPGEINRTASGNLAIKNPFGTPINQQQQNFIPSPNFINGQFVGYTRNEQITRTLMPRPFIPPNRSTIDKILDYFIGDGPSNRYALICRRCHSHNGMALKEEFEYIAFRCAYCSEYNPSRKLKLNAPDIRTLLTQNLSNNQQSKIDSEKEDDNESNNDEKIEEITANNQSNENINDKQNEETTTTTTTTNKTDEEKKMIDSKTQEKKL